MKPLLVRRADLGVVIFLGYIILVQVYQIHVVGMGKKEGATLESFHAYYEEAVIPQVEQKGIPDELFNLLSDNSLGGLTRYLVICASYNEAEELLSELSKRQLLQLKEEIGDRNLLEVDGISGRVWMVNTIMNTF